MANSGTFQAGMPGMWEEDAFHMLFAATGWDKIKAGLDRGETQYETVEMEPFVKVLQKYIPEERLRELYKPEFLEHPDSFAPCRCILYADKPDAVVTLSLYTCDASIARMLTKIFRDRPVKCDWFIDGSGDYGSYTLLDNAYYDYREGNLQEDLEKAENDAIQNAKKAHWINPSRNPEYVNQEFFSDCSECGYTTSEETDTCPNCGAKMEL